MDPTPPCPTLPLPSPPSSLLVFRPRVPSILGVQKPNNWLAWPWRHALPSPPRPALLKVRSVGLLGVAATGYVALATATCGKLSARWRYTPSFKLHIKSSNPAQNGCLRMSQWIDYLSACNWHLVTCCTRSSGPSTSTESGLSK